MALPPPPQGSLPAGWLAFAGRESNPLGRDERFQFTCSSPFPGLILTLHPPLPDARAAQGPASHPALRPVRQRQPRRPYREGARVARGARADRARDGGGPRAGSALRVAAPMPLLRRPYARHRDLRAWLRTKAPPDAQAAVDQDRHHTRRPPQTAHQLASHAGSQPASPTLASDGTIDRCGSHSRHRATTISLVEAFRNGTAQALSELFSIAIRTQSPPAPQGWPSLRYLLMRLAMPGHTLTAPSTAARSLWSG